MITKLLVLDFQNLWQKPCYGMSDKISAPKKKGMWMGGAVPLGYEVKDRALVINEAEVTVIRHIFTHYAELGSVRVLKEMDKIEIDSLMLAMRATASMVIDIAAAGPTSPRDRTEQLGLRVLEGGVGHDCSEDQNR